MHESGCRAEFTERDMKKVLTPKVTNSYFALVQRKELEAAGLENLETCPSCEFAIVIDNEHEKLFTCQHPNCQVVSCRACKKPVSSCIWPGTVDLYSLCCSIQDHIPKTCAEAAAEDEHLNSRHTIEEAMTQVSVDGSIWLYMPLTLRSNCRRWCANVPRPAARNLSSKNLVVTKSPGERDVVFYYR